MVYSLYIIWVVESYTVCARMYVLKRILNERHIHINQYKDKQNTYSYRTKRDFKTQISRRLIYACQLDSFNISFNV